MRLIVILLLVLGAVHAGRILCQLTLLIVGEITSELVTVAPLLRVLAQACGRAVVAGRSGGTAEAMVADETGLLVDCASEAALGAALERLLDAPELRSAMGERGCRWASGFDWNAIAVGAVELWDRFGV